MYDSNLKAIPIEISKILVHFSDFIVPTLNGSIVIKRFVIKQSTFMNTLSDGKSGDCSLRIMTKRTLISPPEKEW